MKQHSIILVHSGDDFFGYINDCISQIKKFNTCKIYLVINAVHKKNISHDDVELIFIDNIKISEKYEKFKLSSKLDRNFRNGFWYYATERFFLIEETMKMLNLDNVFHLENDNLIFLDLSSKLEVFETLYNIAAVFDNDNRSIPSFIYIKNLSSINELTNFILNNPNNNDMELLSNFKKTSNVIDNLPILPSCFSNINFESKLGYKTISKEQYSNNFEKFDSVFDGAAIGQYIGGVDPRNSSENTIGFINESTIFDISQFQFLYELDNIGRKVYYMCKDGFKYKINNLHIHSKNLKKYMS